MAAPLLLLLLTFSLCLAPSRSSDDNDDVVPHLRVLVEEQGRACSEKKVVV